MDDRMISPQVSSNLSNQIRVPLLSENHLWLLILVHIPLAFVLNRTPTLVTAHAVLVGLMGLWAVLFKPKGDPIVIWIAGYIMGAEVMWRVVGASIFYEYGKYATSLVLGLAVLRIGSKARLPASLVIYFICLLPSTVFWIGAPLSSAMNAISFNLSGPFALFICGVFFANVHVDRTVLRKLALISLGPILAMAVIATYSTVTATDLEFVNGAIQITAGGSGTNQVSATLGLGVLLCWMLILDSRSSNGQRILLTGLALFLTGQALLTFSRQGVYLSLLAGVVATLVYLRSHPDESKSKLVVPFVITMIAVPLLLNQLNDFTGGELLTRFSSGYTSHRDDIASSELQTWLENPISGVGPGLAPRVFEITRSADSHTEFTRMLAEHGLFGLIGLIALLSGLFKQVRSNSNSFLRTWVAACLIWGIGYMFVSAMRTLMPSFLIGLAWARFVQEDNIRATKRDELDNVVLA